MLLLGGCQVGDEGLAELAGPLRRRPALRKLFIYMANIGDAGVAASTVSRVSAVVRTALQAWRA